MKKITRDLKKHYRGVERELSNFKIDLSDESWYNGAHWHLDICGYSNLSEKHRKIHLSYYLKLLDKIEAMTINCNKDFQTFIFIDGEWGGYDALFLHTQNPHSDFPMKFEYLDYNINLPKFIAEVLDNTKYRIGKITSEYEGDETQEHKCKIDYIIQKSGLGSIIN